MIHRLERWMSHVFGGGRKKIIHVACVQPLAAGVTLYAIDVDGRRILFGASLHAVCLLDRYQLPRESVASERDLAQAAPKWRQA